MIRFLPACPRAPRTHASFTQEVEMQPSDHAWLVSKGVNQSYLQRMRTPCNPSQFREAGLILKPEAIKQRNLRMAEGRFTAESHISTHELESIDPAECINPMPPPDYDECVGPFEMGFGFENLVLEAETENVPVALKMEERGWVCTPPAVPCGDGKWVARILVEKGPRLSVDYDKICVFYQPVGPKPLPPSFVDPEPTIDHEGWIKNLRWHHIVDITGKLMPYNYAPETQIDWRFWGSPDFGSDKSDPYCTSRLLYGGMKFPRNNDVSSIVSQWSATPYPPTNVAASLRMLVHTPFGFESNGEIYRVNRIVDLVVELNEYPRKTVITRKIRAAGIAVVRPDESFQESFREFFE